MCISGCVAIFPAMYSLTLAFHWLTEPRCSTMLFHVVSIRTPEQWCFGYFWRTQILHPSPSLIKIKIYRLFLFSIAIFARSGLLIVSPFDFDENLRCGGIWPKDSPQDQDCSIWRRRISPRPMGNVWWDYICCLNIRVWKVGMSEKPWLKIVWVSRVFPNFENHTYQYFDLMTQLGSWQTDIDWSYI